MVRFCPPRGARSRSCASSTGRCWRPRPRADPGPVGRRPPWRRTILVRGGPPVPAITRPRLARGGSRPPDAQVGVQRLAQQPDHARAQPRAPDRRLTRRAPPDAHQLDAHPVARASKRSSGAARSRRTARRARRLCRPVTGSVRGGSRGGLPLAGPGRAAAAARRRRPRGVRGPPPLGVRPVGAARAAARLHGGAVSGSGQVGGGPVGARVPGPGTAAARALGLGRCICTRRRGAGGVACGRLALRARVLHLQRAARSRRSPWRTRGSACSSRTSPWPRRGRSGSARFSAGTLSANARVSSGVISLVRTRTSRPAPRFQGARS